MTFSIHPQIQQKTKLTQLDVDSLFIIFKDLNIQDMISLASTNEYISIVVSDYLSSRFSKKFVIFDFTKLIMLTKPRSSRGGMIFVTNINEYGTKNGIIEPKITEKENSIEFEYANDEIKSILKMVGSKIRKLKIIDREFDQLGDDMKIIVNLIEQHCSESLVELHVEQLEKFFESIQKPFKSVHKLSWSTQGRALMIGGNMDKFKLREHFPAMNSLELTKALTSDTSLSIPQMKEFEVFYAFGEQFTDFLKANQQITHLKLYSLNPNELQFIANEMKNLEVLKFKNFDQLNRFRGGNFSFNFERLRSIEIESRWPGTIKFSNKLEEFRSYQYPAEEYIQFMANNPNLKLIKITMCANQVKIKELIAAKLSVNDLKLVIHKNIEPEVIIQLIESCHNLNEFTFRIRGERFSAQSYEEWDHKHIFINHFTNWTFNSQNNAVFTLTGNNDQINDSVER